MEQIEFAQFDCAIRLLWSYLAQKPIKAIKWADKKMGRL